MYTPVYVALHMHLFILVFVVLKSLIFLSLSTNMTRGWKVGATS